MPARGTGLASTACLSRASPRSPPCEWSGLRVWGMEQDMTTIIMQNPMDKNMENERETREKIRV